MLALAIVLLALGATAHGAGGDSSTAVIVQTKDGNRTITTDELKGAYDVFEQPYTVTGEPQKLQINGASLRTVLEQAGVNPDQINFAEIRRGDGSSIVLTAADVAAVPPFPDGPPVVFRDASNTRFLRPVRGPGDSNAADNLATDNAPLVVAVRTGALLHVTADADVDHVEVGDPVRFTATAPDASPGSRIDFDWDFADSTTGSGSSVEHRFDHAGTFRVVAHAVGDDDSAGSSPFVTVVVGDPTPVQDDPGGNGPPTGQDPDGGGPSGTKDGGGNFNDGTPDGTPGFGSGPVTRGDGGSGDPGDDLAPGSTTSPGSALAPAAVPGTSGEGGQDQGVGTSGERGGDDRGDVLVTGRLLSATAAPTTSFAPAAAESAPTEEPGSQTGRGLMIGGGVLLLLAFGGGRELGSPRIGRRR